jgi:hypothetical protein
MAPSKVTDADKQNIWRKMRAKQTSVSRAPFKFKEGQHVRISKERLKFAKGGKQNYTTEIFQIHKVVPRSPKPVYELVDLLGKHIKGQFYAEELSPVIVTKKTVYHIDKILRKRFRNGIMEVYVKSSGYPNEFNSWIPAKAVKNMPSGNEQTHFYITLLSNASQKLYPSNTLTSFTVHLARPVDLGSDSRWKVGAWEVSCRPSNVGTYRAVTVISANNALIYCDLISPQFFGSQCVRVLRTFIMPTAYCNHSFENVYYMPVEKRRFHDI